VFLSALLVFVPTLLAVIRLSCRFYFYFLQSVSNPWDGAIIYKALLGVPPGDVFRNACGFLVRVLRVIGAVFWSCGFWVFDLVFKNYGGACRNF